MPTNLQDLPPDMVIWLSQKMTNPIRFTGRAARAPPPLLSVAGRALVALVFGRADKLMALEVIAYTNSFFGSVIDGRITVMGSLVLFGSLPSALFLWPSDSSSLAIL
jgi:hypothetical protein